jgi:CHAT domain-containing protein
MAARARATSTADSETARLRSHLESARQRLANLVVRGLAGQASDQYIALVEEARAAREDAERALAERSASFNIELSSQRAGLDDVRRALPAGSVLVSFIRHLQSPLAGSVRPRPASARSADGDGIASYIAFVTRSNGGLVVLPLGSARVVDELVSAWRADIIAEPARPRRERAPSRAERVSGERLRNAIWDPIAAHLAGATSVFVVADDLLSLVPIGALPGARAEFVLEEGPTIHYLSAERDLLRPAYAADRTSGRGLLAVGGPSFDDGSTLDRASNPPARMSGPATHALRVAPVNCGTFQTMNFNALAGTVDEVRDVARLWADGRGRVSDSVRLLVATDATERVFKSEAPHHEVIHLATHGFFLGSSCVSATESLRAVGGLAPASGRRLSQTFVPADSPLLLSGIALAGANRRASARANEEDGILTAEEVSALDLSGVRWAVLSACDTGLGEIRSGEGVFGLRRAFQIAGAHTVIMSLWSVEDDATRQWMRALYEGRLQRTLSTADAVREASLTVLKSRRAAGQSTHPFYWAAFVAAGDWR